MIENLDFLAVGPIVAVTAGVVAVLLADVTLDLGSRAWALLAGMALAAASVLAGFQWVFHRGADADVFFSGMLVVDGFSALAGLVIFPLTGMGLLAGWRLALAQGRRGAEFVVLVLLAAIGAQLMAAAGNLVMLFIGLEVFSISLYVLAGFTRGRVDADEAALKYFLLGAFASAIFLYGVALVFAATGSTDIYGAGGIAEFLQDRLIFRPGILLAGIALLLVGLGFKVSAAPFHVWSPDVYQGSPTGITGFLAASAKVAGFAAVGRVLTVALGARIDDWAPAVAVLAAASVVIGTVLAVAQTDLKRMLAYSSVAHAGFILIALVAGRGGLGDMWFYVATYAVQVVAAFAVAGSVSGDAAGAAPLDDYAGLGRRSPALAGTLALMMLAMGGIPLTAGFAGKVAVFQAAVDADYLWLVIVALLSAVAGLFFYLRVIVIMYMRGAEEDGEPAPGIAWGTRVVLAVASLVTVVFGVAPWPLLDVVRDAIPL